MLPSFPNTPNTPTDPQIPRMPHLQSASLEESNGEEGRLAGWLKEGYRITLHGDTTKLPSTPLHDISSMAMRTLNKDVVVVVAAVDQDSLFHSLAGWLFASAATTVHEQRNQR